MTRILFWIALIVLIVMAVRAKIRAMTPKDLGAQRRGAEPPQVESMTQCAHCGLHFPASEAVRADGLDYCSPAHVRLPAK
ncbi:MAG TPA: PP0621 family protein [Telluria sp.]